MGQTAGRRRKHRKLKGGFYGFGGDVLGAGTGSGAALWSRGTEVPGGGHPGRGGNAMSSMGASPHAGTQSGAGRRRRHRGGAAEPPNAQAAKIVGSSGMGSPTVQAAPKSGGTPTGPKLGGRRSRKGRRHSKRKHTRRKMRGGSKFGATFASFVGDGSRGLGNVSQGTHKPGVAVHGAFNDNGAKPGGFQSFKGLSPAKL